MNLGESPISLAGPWQIHIDKTSGENLFYSKD